MTNTPMPEAERNQIISRLRSKHLTTERDTLLLERIEDLVKRQTSKDEIEARGLVVIGESGAGKTRTLKRVFKTQFPNYGEPECPLVTITVPAPCTLMQLGRVGCARLGYPIVGEKKQHRVWEMFRERLELTNTRYLHFDEIQNIMETANVKESANIRNVLKTFLNDPANRVSLILSGLPKIANFLQLDRQESRRCAFVNLASMTEADAHKIFEAAARYASEAGLKIEPHEDAALGLRLLHAACYQLGLALEMTVDAIERALRAGDTTLTRKAYAAEFAARTGCAAAANPFLAANFLDIDGAKVLQTDAYPEAPPQPPPPPNARRPRRTRNDSYNEEI